nr:MAG TPA: hypothetical protein [Caudoviricetes sp.]
MIGFGASQYGHGLVLCHFLACDVMWAFPVVFLVSSPFR